jgi:hypothetical protein
MIELVGYGQRPDNKPLSAPKYSNQPESLAKLREAGYVAYSLAPLYAHVGVEDYIPGRFAAEDTMKGHPGEVHGMILQFKHLVVARCGEWGMKVDVMDEKSYSAFQVWLLAQFFVDRVKKLVYIPMFCPAPVADPLAYAAGKREPATLDVFSFECAKGRMSPIDLGIDRDKVNPYIDFVMRDPSSNTIQTTEAVLGQLNA